MPEGESSYPEKSGIEYFLYQQDWAEDSRQGTEDDQLPLWPSSTRARLLPSKLSKSTVMPPTVLASLFRSLSVESSITFLDPERVLNPNRSLDRLIDIAIIVQGNFVLTENRKYSL